MSTRPARTIVSLVMTLLVAFAIASAARLVIEFFGQLASTGWGEAVVTATNFLMIPFGFSAITTPYGGVFDVNAAAMIVLFLGAEWVVGLVASRV